ncbi:hypothetical protein [Actinacidiphila bryophytorum]|uniref:hypothetical protein n=1 Tax=Actinacidiphila bryophytorum TaxID=1436133 RepID=UPI002176E406|nr:hypothetical protein [Actinacidiphila bryophytorum]UWE10474.1 hypothetical protein NYE86_18275 [Actinacidiphila bryophytorum]
MQREQSRAARREAESARDEARRQSQKEGEVNRIISMRKATRAWSDLLARTIQDLGLGRPVRIEDFDAAVADAGDQAQLALDHALLDGIWIYQSSYGYPAHRAPAGGRSHEQARVLAALRRVTELIREAAINQAHLDDSRSEELKRALDVADEARAALATSLLNRLEQIMEITTIGGPAAVEGADDAVTVRSPRRDSAELGSPDSRAAGPDWAALAAAAPATRDPGRWRLPFSPRRRRRP